MIEEINQDAVAPDGQALTSGVPPVAEAPQEKMVRQSEVNEIAGRIRQDAYEKGRREAEMAAQRPSPSTAEQVASGALSENQVREMVIQETQRAQDQIRQEEEGKARATAVQGIVRDFQGKMAAGIDQHEDFEEKVAQLDLPKIPQLVPLANSVDNTADVMYELANNRSKVGSLLGLIKDAPHLAQLEIARLSSSIKANKAAQQAGQPPEPLNQVKPSTAPVDSGEMSVADYRKQDWLRR